MPNYNYLIPKMEDFRTKVVVQPDPTAAAFLVSLGQLMNYANGKVMDVSEEALRAIVHDYLLLTGAVVVDEPGEA